MVSETLNDLMIDLETLGTKVGSVITSIGAVQFDLRTGEVGKQFYQRIDIQSSLNHGMKVDAGALKFWFEQPDHSRLELTKDGMTLGEALYKFRVFLQELGTADLKVWGNSNRFDLGALESAYSAIKQEIPWYFRNERDVRTLVAFAPDIKKNAVFKGTQHNAIDDCLFQIGYCSEIYNRLTNV